MRVSQTLLPRRRHKGYHTPKVCQAKTVLSLQSEQENSYAANLRVTIVIKGSMQVKPCAKKIVPDQTAPKGAVWSRTICLLSSTKHLLIMRLDYFWSSTG